MPLSLGDPWTQANIAITRSNECKPDIPLSNQRVIYIFHQEKKSNAKSKVQKKEMIKTKSVQ